jgi:hypothetical protein
VLDEFEVELDEVEVDDFTWELDELDELETYFPAPQTRSHYPFDNKVN